MSYVYNPGDPVTVLNASEPADTESFGASADESLRQIKAYLKDPAQSPEVKIAALRTRLNNLIASIGGSSGNVTPPGIVMPFPTTAVPSGWMYCDGSAVSRTTYSGLFAAISVTWGSGDGSTTFNIPDFRHRLLACPDNTFLVVNSGGVAGTSQGSSAHQLTTSEIEPHAHVPSLGNPALQWLGRIGTSGASTRNPDPGRAFPIPQFLLYDGVLQSFGGDVAHNNLQPYQTYNYCIRT